MTSSENIFPIYDQLLQRKDKEELLNQRSVVVWMTGLSGSGKSTIAREVEKKLHERGFLVQVLDGDNVRDGINANLGFSEEDRTENIRRIAEVSKLFINCGVITINCFVSPTEAIRKQVRDIVGDEDLIQIYIKASIEECENRDVKGLYKKARRGEIQNFTGIDAPFEEPRNADLAVDTCNLSIEESVNNVLELIIPRVTYHGKDQIV